MTQYSKTANLLLAALFTALTAVGAYISVPLPFTPVPVTLATLAAMMAGGLLGPKYGSLSQAVYLLLGAAGVPVFHNFTAGIGILAGPTGGYLVGYIVIAFIAGIIIKSKPLTSGRTVTALLLGTAACYALGSMWFIITTETTLTAAIISCVLPFIPGDMLKTAAATALIKRLTFIIKH